MATVNKDFVVRNGVIAGDNVQGVQLVSTTSSQPPLTVTSSAKVENLNADLLDGLDSTYLLDWANTSNKPDLTLALELGGALVGSGSVTFTDLGSATLVLNDAGVALDGVTLGIETYGDYVANIIAGTGVTVSASAGESASPTISIGQDVSTSSNVSFNTVTSTTTASAPFTVSSSVQVNNLNVEYLGGYTLAQVLSGGGVQSVVGTANEIEVSASTGAIQIGLPDNVNVGGSLTVGENLIVTGSVVTINSTVVTIDDPIFTLGGDTAPSVDDNKDRGIEFRYHDGSSAKVGFFGYDDSTGKFAFLTDATNSSEVFTGTKATIDASIEWADVLSKPDPTITLTGDVSGSGTLTDLGSASISVTVEKDFSLTFTGDVTGSGTVNNLGSASISLTIAADSIDLGTDTNGDYVAGIYGTANQVIVSGSGQSASVTLSLPQDIATTSTPTFAGVALSNAAVTSSSVTVTANNTATTIDSFAVSTFTTAEYVIQAKQSTKMTSTKILVMWDGTNAYVSEYAVVDSSAGAANVDFTATESGGTLSVTASSPDAASTNVIIKAIRTSLEA
jgi:hypothetical protein